MAARNKPYEQFGQYILFKKLDSDALGDLWRAGRIEGGRLVSTVALRRLSGGSRAALSSAATVAGAILPQLSGSSFVRGQAAGVIDGVPFLAWEYTTGRTLRHIVDRSRGGRESQPNPLPLDQAVVIAERVALSLATVADFRDTSGSRLFHGALLPQFVWIGDDGDIRVAGQQLSEGVVASLSDPRVAAEMAPYFSPESRTAGARAGDVYSMGAILFLLVTGSEPPDAANASAFASAVRAAKTPAGTPIPDDIRVILDKSLNIDPSMRYASVGDMKQALSALAHGGRYSASTFNLAFYLSTLLKKEMEAEALDREKEARVNIAPYLEPPSAAAAEAVHAPAPAMFTAAESPAPAGKSRMPLAIAAAALLVAAGVGGWMMLKPSAAAPAARPAAATMAPVAAKPPRPVISEPIVASATPQAPAAATATGTAVDAETQKKAFEDAVRQKLQAELLKLQNDYLAELKQKQSKNAPVPSAAPAAPAPAAEDPAPVSAAQLDQQRREAAASPATPQAPAPAPAVQQQAAAPAPVTPPPAVAAGGPAIREGDVVSVESLDSLPRPLRAITPGYPPMARQQRIAATVLMTVLVTEGGNVSEVKVLKGEARFGINDAAVRAMKAAKFSPPMKDGKRVKTWFPQTIEFRP